jgi:hypothetical protein
MVRISLCVYMGVEGRKDRTYESPSSMAIISIVYLDREHELDILKSKQ